MVEAPETIEWLYNQNKSVLVDRIGRLERENAELRVERDTLAMHLDAKTILADRDKADKARLSEALRSIAEGNLGDASWQANYDRIREVARAALSGSGAGATPPSGEALDAPCFGWKCNNCGAVFTAEQKVRRDENNGGPNCPHCKAYGQYTYRYNLHQGDPCIHCGTPHDEVASGPCATLSSAPARAGGWRTLESAPKENPEWVFLYVPGHGPARAIWRRKRKWWESHTTGREITAATHWMPLPLPPEGM